MGSGGACSRSILPAPDFFSEQDRDALAAVAGWIGLIMHRAELVEQHDGRGRASGTPAGRRRSGPHHATTAGDRKLRRRGAHERRHRRSGRAYHREPWPTTSRTSCGDLTSRVGRRSLSGLSSAGSISLIKRKMSGKTKVSEAAGAVGPSVPISSTNPDGLRSPCVSRVPDPSSGMFGARRARKRPAAAGRTQS